MRRSIKSINRQIEVTKQTIYDLQNELDQCSEHEPEEYKAIKQDIILMRERKATLLWVIGFDTL